MLSNLSETLHCQRKSKNKQVHSHNLKSLTQKKCVTIGLEETPVTKISRLNSAFNHKILENTYCKESRLNQKVGA